MASTSNLQADPRQTESSETIPVKFRERMRLVIAETLGVPLRSVQMDSRLVGDLGADSLDLAFVLQDLVQAAGLAACDLDLRAEPATVQEAVHWVWNRTEEARIRSLAMVERPWRSAVVAALVSGAALIATQVASLHPPVPATKAVWLAAVWIILVAFLAFRADTPAARIACYGSLLIGVGLTIFVAVSTF